MSCQDTATFAGVREDTGTFAHAIVADQPFRSCCPGSHLTATSSNLGRLIDPNTHPRTNRPTPCDPSDINDTNRYQSGSATPWA